MIRMPAEWEKQEAVWVAWPHNLFWPGYSLKLEGTYLRLIEIMKASQIVRIIVPDKFCQWHIELQLDFHEINRRNIEFFVVSTNDIWIRDYGPTFVEHNGGLAAVKRRFNGYGRRFEYDLDDAAGARIPEMLGVSVIETAIVLEGGNLETNGAGTIMLCKSAILNPNRNPEVSQGEAESVLERCLGAKRFIWLTGLVTENVEETGWSDDTDTHVDTIVRFTAENRVVAVWTDDKNDPLYELLQATHRELKEEELEVVNLPVVKGGFYSTSKIGVGGGISGGKVQRTDASYANFLICNGVVVVPVYGRPEDEIAKAILREQFPDRKVVGLFAGSLAENGGEFHCITQQEPEV